MIYLMFFLLLNTTVLGFKLETFFSHWHCIGIKENIDLSRPYKINIGELPLVVWQNKETGKLTTAINICKHMGSKLDNGVITNNGCLKCQYHGLENSHEDRFGETMIHDGKIFWSYKPITAKPYSIPFFNNRNFVTSFLEMDMECSLTDSAYNTMDLRHPEYVHDGLLGFGNSVPPKNIIQYKYKYSDQRVGLSFLYESNKSIRKMNMGSNFTDNFHMYIYPTFSWSKVTFDKNNHLIIGVNLLPIENKKTRWYVTICNNYLKTPLQQQFIKLLASTILSQDYIQMKNQCKDDELKNLILFKHIFTDEEIMLWLRDIFKDYTYPDTQICVDLYKDYMNKKNIK